MNHRIFALGDNALTVEFGSEISFEMNDAAVRLAAFFDANPFRGLIETIPAYASLTIFFDVALVRKTFPDFPTAFAAVRNLAEKVLSNPNDSAKSNSRLIEIPVSFAAADALDLEFVARINDLSAAEVVEIFLARTYRVFMLGFLPGFSYMGEVDERIAAPRKGAPRLQVPKGSVGIAGRQTGIYSLESPGGWQIVGRTDIEMFTPNEKSPTFLQTGDSVKFYRV